MGNPIGRLPPTTSNSNIGMFKNTMAAPSLLDAQPQQPQQQFSDVDVGKVLEDMDMDFDFDFGEVDEVDEVLKQGMKEHDGGVSLTKF